MFLTGKCLISVIADMPGSNGGIGANVSSYDTLWIQYAVGLQRAVRTLDRLG